jgi:acyl dehydratase
MPFATRDKDRAASRFEMRLTASERVQLREDADLAGLSISEFVRRRTFGKTIHAATDLMMIRELRRLGGLQKYAMNKLAQHDEVVGECVATIRSLRAAIERVASNDR